MSWQNHPNGPQQPWGLGPNPNQPYPHPPYPNQQPNPAGQGPPQGQYGPPQAGRPQGGPGNFGHHPGDGGHPGGSGGYGAPTPGGPKPKGPGRAILIAAVAVVVVALVVVGAMLVGTKMGGNEVAAQPTAQPAGPDSARPDSPQTPGNTDRGSQTPKPDEIELAGGVGVRPEPGWTVKKQQQGTVTFVHPGSATFLASVGASEGKSAEEVARIWQDSAAQSAGAQKGPIEKVDSTSGLEVARASVRITTAEGSSNTFITVGVNQQRQTATASLLIGPSNMTIDTDPRLKGGITMTNSLLESQSN